MTQLSFREETAGFAKRETLFLAWLAALVSLFSFLYYFQHGQILFYGDAVAHINIARRVFDSQTPGLLQLGTVWLPLPHLLMLPFLLSDWMWQTGIGGSIPSMIAYVFGAIGIFRLTRDVLESDARTKPAAGVGAWLAAFVYAANPNLIYLQATAMTEALYLAFFIWAVVYFFEFVLTLQKDAPERNRALFPCAGCLACAELTRYDGWLLATALGLIVALLSLQRWHDRTFRRMALKFLLVIAAAPLMWLAYNTAVYGNPLEFANGPYSAKAIEQRTAKPGYPAHPGAGNLSDAATFFLKSAELDMASGNWGRIWIVVALAGVVLATIEIRRKGVLLLLVVPLVFYTLSIAYGGVPIFLPVWWPFSWYNLRYGLQLLPLFAVSVGLIASAIPELTGRWPTRKLGMAVLALLVVLSYFSVWKAKPRCFEEAWVNSRTKLALESAVAHSIAAFPERSVYLMYLGDHVGAFQQSGVPLRQVIDEGNHRPWKRPSDAEGLWERALADPAQYVDYVIAFQGDAVDQQVARGRLTLLTEIHTKGQPAARIYAARAALNQSR